MRLDMNFDRQKFKWLRTLKNAASSIHYFYGSLNNEHFNILVVASFIKMNVNYLKSKISDSRSRFTK